MTQESWEKEHTGEGQRPVGLRWEGAQGMGLTVFLKGSCSEAAVERREAFNCKLNSPLVSKPSAQPQPSPWGPHSHWTFSKTLSLTASTSYLCSITTLFVPHAELPQGLSKGRNLLLFCLCFDHRLIVDIMERGFPCGSMVKKPPASVDVGSIPGSRRSPGGGNGNPLQYSCTRTPWTEEPGGLQTTGSLSQTLT